MSEEESNKRRRRTGWDTAPSAPAQATASYYPPVYPSLGAASMNPMQAYPLPPSQTALQPQLPLLPQTGGLSVPGLGLGQASLTSLPGQGKDPKMDCRVYIGSLHYDIGQAEIMALFSCFGTITRLDMSHDPNTGKSKGFCFLEYAEPASAQAAMAMDGFEVAQRKIKVGRPYTGAYAATGNTSITPVHMAVQHAAQLALSSLTMTGALPPTPGVAAVTGGLPPTLPGVTPALSLNTAVSTTPYAPAVSPVIPPMYSAASLGAPIAPVPTSALTPAQLSAKERAQALLNKLGQSVGLVPAPTKVQTPSNAIAIKNLRAEVGLSELGDIFSSFGTILSSKVIGDPYTVISTSGQMTTVKTVHMEFDSSKAADDAISLHNSDLAGVLLTVELLPSSTTSTASTTNTTITTTASNVATPSSTATATSIVSATTTPSSSNEESKTGTNLMLENLVGDLEEVFEEDFQDEIHEEAEKYGRINTMKILIDDIDVTNKDLQTYQNMMKDEDAASDSTSTTSVKKAVKVILMYDNSTSCENAQKAFHGRYFDGQTIKATIMTD